LRNRFAGYAFLAVMSIAIAVGILEFGLRAFRIQYPSPAEPDTLIGWRFKPGARYMFRKEGFSKGRINSKGLRDVEHEYTKEPGTCRIVFLGDSYVEALQVEQDSCFVRRVEKELSAACPEERFETINMGRSGMGTAEELLYYTREGQKYSPDLVLLVFFPNDYRDNSRKLDVYQSVRPYFVDRGRGLELDTSFRNTRGFKLRKTISPLKNRSSLVSLAIEAYYRFKARKRQPPPPPKPPAKRAEVTPRLPGGPGTDLFSRQPSPAWLEAYRVTSELLKMVNRAVTSTGARLAVVVIPTAMASQEPKRSLAEREHPEWDLDLPVKRVTSLCAAERIPCLDLTRDFLEFSRMSGKYLYGFGKLYGSGHLNYDGHRVAAKAITRFLVEEKLIPPGTD